jgi:hypothetical protein
MKTFIKATPRNLLFATIIWISATITLGTLIIRDFIAIDSLLDDLFISIGGTLLVSLMVGLCLVFIKHTIKDWVYMYKHLCSRKLNTL